MFKQRNIGFKNTSVPLQRIGFTTAASTGVLLMLVNFNALAASADTTLDSGQATQSPSTPKLATVVVVGGGQTDAQKDEVRLKNTTPGAVSVIENKDIERGRAANAEDVLKLQPGIFAQATSGTGANKISIRGSGLNAFYQGYSLGIKYLYDGMPVTGPGGTQEDLLDMAAVNHTEVLYGANAFAYTALSLGGAINFVSNTGYTAPGNYARFEVGSYGYSKEQLSTGGVEGDTDYYVSVLHNQRDGYQDKTPNSGHDLVANVGHVFNPKLETRFYLRYREEELLNGSTLTKEQIKHDPTANNVYSGRKKNGTTLFGNKTTYTFDDDAKLEVGLSINNYPLVNGWRYSTTPQDWRSRDTNITLRYLRNNDHLFGLTSNSTATFSNTVAQFADVKSYDRTTDALIQHTNYTGSRDTVFALGNDLQLAEKWWLTTGVSLIQVDRRAEIEDTTLPNTSQFGNGVSYVETDVAPRIGLRYQITPDVQIYGNVSRSVDPPVTWQLGSTTPGYIRDVRPQKGTTAELGIRGSAGIFDGSLTVYRSWVQKEILNVVITQATSTADALTAASNGSPTIHQGIEAGLGVQLWEGQSGDTVTLRQAFTVNDFFYRHDAVFGDNELPSMPREVYQAQLVYNQSQGYYAELNAQSVSSYYVDYANTLSAPSYTIFGAKLGYEAPSKRWNVFVDFRNLTNEHYATAANTTYDAKGKDSANFYVGDAFNVTTGVSFHF
jgi:iron complex outermembrane receptor protein